MTKTELYETQVNTTKLNTIDDESTLLESFGRYYGYMQLYLAGEIPFSDTEVVLQIENKILQQKIGRNLLNGN